MMSRVFSDMIVKRTIQFIFMRIEINLVFEKKKSVFTLSKGKNCL